MLDSLKKGLEDVVVDTTSISDVDGEQGHLIYRDRPIEDLAVQSFVQVAYLVIFGRWPEDTETAALEAFLVRHSQLNADECAVVNALGTKLHPMRLLQGLAALLNTDSLETETLTTDVEVKRGLVLAAKLSTALAYRHRLEKNLAPVSKQTGLRFLENFFFQFHGKLPQPQQIRILETVQILQLEHGFNASTFAARVVASTLASPESCISAAIGCLSGPLHGGADQAALEFALNVGHPDRAEKAVIDALRAGTKIPGMGHRIYRVIDPRAQILKPMARDLCLGTPMENLYLILERIEETMETAMKKRGKQIKANVEFYKGIVFYSLGFPPEYFTALFAISRSFGYLAHIAESRKSNRLIRPRALYVSNTKTI